MSKWMGDGGGGGGELNWSIANRHCKINHNILNIYIYNYILTFISIGLDTRPNNKAIIITFQFLSTDLLAQ